MRFSVLATNTAEPCLDELEVFAADEMSERNLALASAGAKPAASSVYSNGTSDLHKLEHVNDGRYGNARSWISAEAGAGWVQIELAEAGHDRARRVGPRPRRQIPRPAGDALQDRGQP